MMGYHIVSHVIQRASIASLVANATTQEMVLAMMMSDGYATNVYIQK